MSDLLDGEQLESSSVVANSTMNRERELAGSNSYTRDLSFSTLEFLTGRLVRQERVAWLDLCCGAGRALIEAGRRFQEQGLAGRVSIVGVDLVAMFYPFPEGWSFLRLVEASLSTWEPEGRCDLITCVHGMHYVGDKMDLLRRASWSTTPASTWCRCAGTDRFTYRGATWAPTTKPARTSPGSRR